MEKVSEYLKDHPEALPGFAIGPATSDGLLPARPEISVFVNEYDRDWTIIYEVVGTGEDFIELKPAVISGAIDDIIPADRFSAQNRWAKSERLILPTSSIKSIHIAPPTTAP